VTRLTEIGETGNKKIGRQGLCLTPNRKGIMKVQKEKRIAEWTYFTSLSSRMNSEYPPDRIYHNAAGRGCPAKAPGRTILPSMVTWCPSCDLYPYTNQRPSVSDGWPVLPIPWKWTEKRTKVEHINDRKKTFISILWKGH
jgi:hypothetical protein